MVVWGGEDTQRRTEVGSGCVWGGGHTATDRGRQWLCVGGGHTATDRGTVSSGCVGL